MNCCSVCLYNIGIYISIPVTIGSTWRCTQKGNDMVDMSHLHQYEPVVKCTRQVPVSTGETA